MKKNIKIFIDNEFGWRSYKIDKTIIWYKGYFNNGLNIEQIVKKLFKILETYNFSEINSFLKELDGHFSLVVKAELFFFASVDRMRTIPLFYVDRKDEFLITDQPEKILNELNFNEKKINSENELIVRMSGYCFESETLLSGLNQIQQGEFVFLSGYEISFHQYYSYKPFIQNEDNTREFYKNKLTSIVKRIIKKLIASADGRTIIVPLSGGYDSRLIVSGLAKLKYKNVKCISYGRKNNFEARASKIISDQLGFPWKFIELTPGIIKKDYSSELHRKYSSFCNTFSSVPVEHDFSVIKKIIENQWVSSNSIFVNGLIGDFFTGSHIPKSLQFKNNKSDKNVRKKIIINSLIEKHYSLWKYLITDQNKSIIEDKIWKEIEKESNFLPFKYNNDYGLYEFSEFMNRHTKYVMTCQRVYEFFGFEWRLPLCDKEYMDFWETIPLEHKKNRNLFVETMKDNNWGGVWNKKLPSFSINSKLIIIIRFFFKIPFFFIGKKKWREFDKRFFYYWTEILCKLGVVSYLDIVFDRKGYRSAVSWLTEKYLKRIHKIIKTS